MPTDGKQAPDPEGRTTPLAEVDPPEFDMVAHIASMTVEQRAAYVGEFNRYDSRIARALVRLTVERDTALQRVAELEKRNAELGESNLILANGYRLKFSENFELQNSWRCFQCSFLFTNENEAREHFGLDSSKPAACIAERDRLREALEKLLKSIPTEKGRYAFRCCENYNDIKIALHDTECPRRKAIAALETK